MFSDKSANKSDSVVRVVQASNLRESSIPPESALRPNSRRHHAVYRGSHVGPLHEEDVPHEHLPQEQRSSKRRKLQEIEMVEDSLDEPDGSDVVGGDRWLGNDEDDEGEDDRNENSVLEDTFQRMHSPELGGGTNGRASPGLSPPTPAGDDIEIISASQTSVPDAQLPNGVNGSFPAASETKHEIQSSPMPRRLQNPMCAGVESPSLPAPPPTKGRPPSQAANRPRYNPSPTPSQPPSRHRSSATTPSSAVKRKGRNIYDFPSTDEGDEVGATPRPPQVPRKKNKGAKPTKGVPAPPSVQPEHEHRTSSQKSDSAGTREARMRLTTAQLGEEDRLERELAKRGEDKAIAAAEEEEHRKEARKRASQAAEEHERRQRAEQARLAQDEAERLAKERMEEQRSAKNTAEETNHRTREEEEKRPTIERADQNESPVKTKAKHVHLDQENAEGLRLEKEKVEEPNMAKEQADAEPPTQQKVGQGRLAEQRPQDEQSTIDEEEGERLEKKKGEAAEETRHQTDAAKKALLESNKKLAAAKKERNRQAKEQRARELAELKAQKEEKKAQRVKEQEKKAQQVKEQVDKKAQRMKEQERKAQRAKEQEERKAQKTKELEQQKAQKAGELEEKTKENAQQARALEQQKAKAKEVEDEAAPEATKPEAMSASPEVPATKKRARRDSEPAGDGATSPDAKISGKRIRTFSPIAILPSKASPTTSAERDMGPPPVPNSAMKRSNLKKESSSQDPSSTSKKRNTVSFAEELPGSQGFPGSSAPGMISTPTPIVRPSKRTPIVCPLPAAAPVATTKAPSFRVVTPILPPGLVKASEGEANKPPARESETGSGSESESGSSSESENEAVPPPPPPTKADAATKPKMDGKLLVAESSSKASKSKANAPWARSAPAQTNNDDSDIDMQDVPPPSTAPVSSSAALLRKPSSAARVSRAAPEVKSAPYVVSSDSESKDDEMRPPPSAQIPKSKPQQSSQASRPVAAEKLVPATESDASGTGSETGSDAGSDSYGSDDEENCTRKAASALNSLLGNAKSTGQSLVKPKAVSPATTKKLNSLGDLENRRAFDVREIHTSQQSPQQASQSAPSSQPAAKNTKPVANRAVEPESESESGSGSGSDSDSDDGSKSKGAIPDHKKAGSNKKKPAGAMGFGRMFSGA